MKYVNPRVPDGMIRGGAVSIFDREFERCGDRALGLTSDTAAGAVVRAPESIEARIQYDGDGELPVIVVYVKDVDRPGTEYRLFYACLDVIREH